ncbi:hypothetical protein Salat_0954800 [Sesamum alatum]|uniref:Transmembrane protein n=1 Tax=Sesamum alatum TaxID=300844 RepID=A0AAE2CRL5_9LAMI|nr:hypothetical protein Salat_0954800 [Sesamum alatum]
MELFKSYNFFTILNESIKLLPKNGKLMAFIAIFSAVLSSSFLLLFNYSLQSLVADMLATAQQSLMPDPSSFDIPADPSSLSPSDPASFMPTPGLITGQLGHLGDDFACLLALQAAFVLAVSIISFLSAVSTILVSAVSYSSKTLSLKDLFSSIGATWTRPLITSLYVSGLAMGYVVVVVMLVAPLLMYSSRVAFWMAVLVGITASIYYLYLFVAWALAVVVSVVEEGCYGMEALGRSARLVKGKRVHGFLLNVSVNVVVLVIYEAYRMISGHKGLIMNTTMYGVFVVSVATFAKIFIVVAYTVLYFHCKKHHGEEIELHGSFFYQYAKLPTTQ